MKSNYTVWCSLLESEPGGPSWWMPWHVMERGLTKKAAAKLADKRSEIWRKTRVEKTVPESDEADKAREIFEDERYK